MTVVSAVLVWAGVLMAAWSAIRLVLAREPMMRLHHAAVGTAVAAPLTTLGLALAAWSSWHDVVKLLMIGVLLFGTGPAVVSAVGRAARGLESR